MLVHFGTHMWYDLPCDPERERTGVYGGIHDRHFFDYGVWRDWTQAMARSGVNTLVVDVGETPADCVGLAAGAGRGSTGGYALWH